VHTRVYEFTRCAHMMSSPARVLLPVLRAKCKRPQSSPTTN
jgi:hypothetical protein